ncbi:MAG: hydrogenase iron-sulfur subunit [Candidatus Korarchaeota archaeon]|nr:hydrogenase iron-sulfur subunit [Candidatus Korarchaeota archaeon]
MMTVKEFEPRIVVFACNWCSYAGADLAGVSRIQYPPTVRIIRVMCSSRVDPAFILKAFLGGADGVLVAGCHLGDCHYIEGNYNTEKRIKETMKALEYVGFKAGRLRLEWISASEGQKFANVVREFTDQLKELGPNPMGKTGDDLNG